MHRACLVLLLSAAASSASAQSPVSQLKARVADTFAQAPAGTVVPSHAVRVQSTISYFVQAPSGSGAEAIAAQTAARRQFYTQAGKECDVLLQTIAATCRLDQVNVNIQNQNQRYNTHQPEGFSLNGTVGFSITPK